jgi:hypothetical protein
LLIHRPLGGGSALMPADADLPTCLRNHSVPLGEQPARAFASEGSRDRSEKTRKEAVEPRWQARVNFALSGALRWDEGAEFPLQCGRLRLA